MVPVVNALPLALRRYHKLPKSDSGSRNVLLLPSILMFLLVWSLFGRIFCFCQTARVGTRVRRGRGPRRHFTWLFGLLSPRFVCHGSLASLNDTQLTSDMPVQKDCPCYGSHC